MQTLQQRPVDLSIIVPVYNLEKFLDPLLRSLKEQDFGPYNVEIVFVLNNCTDRSEDVIRESGLPCRILACTTQGCGPARNTGLEATTGEYIWFMDGDDWLLYDTAVRDALDRAKFNRPDVLRIPFTSNLFHRDYFSMVWQYLLKRDFVKEFRFPDFMPSEDDAYMAEVLGKMGLKPWEFLWLPKVEGAPLYYYNYLREGSNMYRVNVLREKI